MSYPLHLTRLIVLVVAMLTATLLVHAQQLQSASDVRAGQRVDDPAAAVEPASLIGLTKRQVEGRLGKPSAAFAVIWNYKQRKGTLHVRFNRGGVVSDAKIDVAPRSSSKG